MTACKLLHLAVSILAFASSAVFDRENRPNLIWHYRASIVLLSRLVLITLYISQSDKMNV